MLLPNIVVALINSIVLDTNPKYVRALQRGLAAIGEWHTV